MDRREIGKGEKKSQGKKSVSLIILTTYHCILLYKESSFSFGRKEGQRQYLTYPKRSIKSCNRSTGVGGPANNISDKSSIAVNMASPY